MISNNYKIVGLIAGLLILSGCSKQIDDPVFDYNLKSAKVINTNNYKILEIENDII